jgi:transposase-like protein
MECENCGAKETYENAYDDRNFWDNVIPDWKCKKCGKSTNNLDIRIKQHIKTRYPEGEDH